MCVRLCVFICMSRSVRFRWLGYMPVYPVCVLAARRPFGWGALPRWGRGQRYTAESLNSTALSPCQGWQRTAQHNVIIWAQKKKVAARTVPPNVRGEWRFTPWRVPFFFCNINVSYLLLQLPFWFEWRKDISLFGITQSWRSRRRIFFFPHPFSSHVWGQDASSPLSLAAFIRGSDQ